MQTNSSPSVNLHTLASEVAKNLPGKWTVDADIDGSENWNQFLTRESDGLKLFFAGSRGGWAAKGKIRVSFSRPRANGSWIDIYENGNKVIDPEIGISETKTPAQIAQSIVSRLLAEAERVFALVNAQIAKNNHAEKAKNDLIALFASATGESASHNGSFYVNGFNFEIRSENSVAIKSFGTDRETALAIAAWLKARETVNS